MTPMAFHQVAASEDGYFDGSVEAHETLTMSFGVFLDQIEEVRPPDQIDEVREVGGRSVGDRRELEEARGRSDGAGHWRRRPSRLHLHLAQCPLSAFPTLESDAAPPRCVAAAAAAQDDAVVRTNLWLCLSPARSALHYDCFDNLLMVLRGHKRVVLLPPSATRRLRPRAAHTLSANRSALPRTALEATLASLEASGLAVAIDVPAGHTLFIPEGWWHAVDSTEEVTETF